MQALTQLLDHERRVRDAEGTAGAADAQARQLHAYRSEYVERWSARFREPGSVALMQCYQGFMQRLEQAIAQQRATVQLANTRLEQARQALSDNERRVASVEKLIQRRAQQEQQRAARREQSHSDEIAQRAYARHHAAPSPTELGDLPR